MSDYGSLSSSEASVRMMPLVEQALAIDDRLAGAWQHLAYVRRVNNDFEGARAAEERALELDPQNPLVLKGQIAHWQWTHEAERGLVYADELLRVDPLSPSSLIRISEFYLRIGRLDEAEKNHRAHRFDRPAKFSLFIRCFCARGRSWRPRFGHAMDAAVQEIRQSRPGGPCDNCGVLLAARRCSRRRTLER